MFKVLDPLHSKLDKEGQTSKEICFCQAYGRDLREAKDWCQRYKVSNRLYILYFLAHILSSSSSMLTKYLYYLQISKDKRVLTNAWDLYYHVFRRITRQLPQLTSLELQYVSPQLRDCKDLELAIPGSYSPGQPVVRIAYIHSSLEVTIIILTLATYICMCVLYLFYNFSDLGYNIETKTKKVTN